MVFRIFLVTILLSAALNEVIGDLTCVFDFEDLDDNGRFYTCYVNNQIFRNERDLEVVTGLHLSFREDADVSAMIARESTIELFPSLIGNNFPNLQMIDLAGCEVKTFYREVENCFRVKQLDLSHNKISNIPAGTFKACISLFNISLNDNQIENLDIESFAGLSELYALNLKNNKIKTISATILRFDKLTYFYLSGNQIEAIPSGFFDAMPSLLELTLSNNQISHWNSSIFTNASSLTILLLDGNLIANLDDDAFENLPKLQKLSIGSLLEKIPEFQNLSNLFDLNLDNNRIQEVSLKSFVRLPRLAHLNINNNRIETINFTAFENDQFFPYMTALSLKNNSIKTLLPNAFTIFFSLLHLDLAENKIQQLNDNFFKTNMKGPSLDVTNNNISRIGKDALRIGSDTLTLKGKGNFCFDTDIKICIKNCFDSTGAASTSILNVFVLFSSIFFCLLLKQ